MPNLFVVWEQLAKIFTNVLMKWGFGNILFWKNGVWRLQVLFFNLLMNRIFFLNCLIF
jgi:hypothetical protein